MADYERTSLDHSLPPYLAMYSCSAPYHHHLPSASPLQGGQTPLHFSADAGQIGLIIKLLALGADIDAKCEEVLLLPPSHREPGTRRSAYCLARCLLGRHVLHYHHIGLPLPYPCPATHLPCRAR